MITKTEQIRTLNDDLRQHLVSGIAVITPGVAALGQGCDLNNPDRLLYERRSGHRRPRGEP